jgi:hypothetical protein
MKEKNSKAGHIVGKINGPSDAPFILPTKDQSGGFHKVMQKTINTSNSKPKLFSPKVKSFFMRKTDLRTKKFRILKHIFV